jgi:hypothetical protein
MNFLSTVENWPYCIWIRESGSLWAYPTILFLHTLGLGVVMGLNSAIDLRVLGFASRMPIKPLERFFPWIWWGFWINAISGVILLMADATTKMINPVFYVKMVFIALAVVVLVLLRKNVFDNPGVEKSYVAASAKVLAGLSLLFWIGAVTAGRLMAYLGPVSGVSGLHNRF